MRILCTAISQRRASFNKQLAGAFAQEFLRHSCQVTELDFTLLSIPLFDGEEAEQKRLPQGVYRLQEQLVAHDALVLCSPEYNSSLSSVLKNAIDWLSVLKPSPFLHKPILLGCATPSETKGKMGLWQARIPLEALFARVYPEMFCLNKANQAFDEQGNLHDSKTQERLRELVKDFLHQSNR